MDSATTHGTYLGYIDEYLKELGYDTSQVFRCAGIENNEDLHRIERISMTALAEIIDNVNQLVGNSGFFIDIGARLPIMANGILGAAIMACGTLRDVFTLVERYSAIVLPSFAFSLNENASLATINFKFTTPSPSLNEALKDALISTLIYNFAILTGQPFYPEKIYLLGSAPAHAHKYAEIAHCNVVFGADYNALVFTKAQLDIPIQTANTISQRLLTQQCETALKKVQSNTLLTDRIREIISLYLDSSPSISFIAEKLRVSERTLRRRLNDEGINYRDLMQSVRLETAAYYLSSTQMRIDQIADLLGYSETANFRKAFRAFTGQSPREWRESQRNKLDTHYERTTKAD
jgi:AraC-like DNA-binding protein